VARRAAPPGTRTLWARERPDGPWLLDVKLERVEAGEWIYRRNEGVSRPLDEIGIELSGVPALRPEIVLLYLSGSQHPHDVHAAYRERVGQLDPPARRWLDEALAIVGAR